MFLDWIAQLGLLQHDPQTNILSSLPLLSQRLIISEVTSHIVSSDLSSPAHVTWYMEVLGQGFNLPLEDMGIASDDVDIYSTWLFEKYARPSVINEDEQAFYRKIFCQFSLLFQPRLYKNTSPLVQRHIDLCKKALRTLLTAGRTLKLDLETWTVLLKVTLGITDYLLKEPTLASSMPDELCDDLIETLIELWLRSNLMQIDMWNMLKTCFNRWTHRSKVIYHWNNICLLLTKHVHQLTCVKGSKQQQQQQQQHPFKFTTTTQQELNLPSEFVHYAWHRFTYLISNPLLLAPHNFTIAMLGISACVDALSQPNQDTSTVAIHVLDYPDGNTLLHMYGHFLFDACTASNGGSGSGGLGSEKGCAESFATLIRIFTTPQKRHPFLHSYIETFYAALVIGLKSDACLPTILLSSTQLFATNLKGVRMLVSDYIIAIRRILPKLKLVDYRGHVSIENLRLAAIKVLSTIMCIPNYFHFEKSSYAFKMEQTLDSATLSSIGEQEQLTTQLIRVLYADGNEDSVVSLKFYILETLVMSLRTESSSYNMRYILHLINVYVIEDVSFCPGLVGTVVKFIQEKILTMQLPADVTLVAFDVLMHFVDAYEFIKRDSKNVSRELVLDLCRYIDTLIYNDNLTQIYPLVVQAYECMMAWILVSRWIVDDHDCYKAVITTLSKGITLLDRDQPQPTVVKEKKKVTTPTTPSAKQLFQLPPRKQINDPPPPSPPASNNNSSTVKRNKKEEIAVQMAAEHCMSQFINHFGRYTMMDSKVINKMDEDKQARYFMMDHGVILAMYELSDTITPSVGVTVRNATGGYSWRMHTSYYDRLLSEENNNIPLSSSPPPLPVGIPVIDEPISNEKREFISVPTTTEDDLPTLDSLFSAGWSEQCESLLKLMEQNVQSSLNQVNISKQEPAKSRLDYQKSAFRLLLAQLGFLLPINMNRIKLLSEKVKVELDVLDQLSERDCISMSIYYAQKGGNMKWNELINAKTLTEPFLQFIHCIGWPVALKHHQGYKAKLNNKLCDNLIYYSNRSVEVVMNIPYLLNDPIMQQAVASEDHLCLIWMEEMENYKELAKEIKSQCPKSMVYLFIHPLENTADSLYWIRILVPPFGNTTSAILASQRLHENALIFGPLVDGMVVSKHALGPMIRSTAISAHQSCRIVTDTFSRPHVVRRNYIKYITENYATPLSLSNFYNDIFS